MRLKNTVLPVLALAGIVMAVVISLKSERARSQSQAVAQPAQAPFAAYIGGAGIVEANSNNIALGTSVGGVVAHVYVEAGDTVQAGQALFDIDGREALSEREVKRASLLKAKAALEEAKASLKDYQTQFAIVRDVKDRRAVSVDEVEKRRNAEALAKAKLESAKAAVTASQAELAAAETTVDRLTVRAPIACEVLQVNVRPGEFAATGSLSTPLMRLGNLDRMQVRVDVDENDAWRFVSGARGMAYMRGNRDIKAELTFVRVEPYVVPKSSLTGSSTERVDTRVLQVVYSFDRKQLPAFVGQQLDVFLETPVQTSTAAASDTGSGS
ncbi:efflux RND transporter periplasmic adaptor subunit [Fundidesulfovibrio terrae]|uniref:efflux RND transporter periplasmic adaptor subunit n=1 Tax=Fundidesulfovibrio terrae TaxID=2922866 RepID=UPI001FAF3A7C